MGLVFLLVGNKKNLDWSKNIMNSSIEFMSASVSSIEKPYVLDLQSMNRQQKR